jgi:acetyl-CoA carboxylase biotin carboxyl carrier protein
MDLTHDDVINILRLIDQSSYEELRLEVGGLTLTIKKKGAGNPLRLPAAPGSAEGDPAAVASTAGAPKGGILPNARENATAARNRTSGALEVRSVLRAPMVGIFYRAPAPGAPPFVEIGSLVTEDETVCIIEVMKLMHAVKAGCNGRVAEILAENAGMVEYGQPLMVIEPVS